MTIKELVRLTGVSRQTITRLTKKLLPEIIRHGVKTVFDKEQATLVVMELKKKGLVSVVQNEQVVSQNEQVNRLDRLESMMEKLLMAIPKMLNLPQARIEQDYYSILGYCNFKGLKLVFSEAIKMGKLAKSLSIKNDREVRKIPDERFGKVNSYHIDILSEVFSI